VLKLHTFGAVYIARDGQPLAGAAGQRRLLALLATLAASGEGGVSRDKLLGLLWPEAQGDRARHALTQALYNARRALGDENLFAAGTDIRLNAHRISSDVGAFLDAIDRGDDVTASREYQGPFLDGFFISAAPEFDQWAASQRARLGAEAVQALDRLAAAAKSRGEVTAATKIRRRIVMLDPLDSSAVLELMTSLADAGDVTGAIQHARVHEALLRQQIEVSPDPRIVALVNQLKDGSRRTHAPGADPTLARATEPTERNDAAVRFVEYSRATRPVHLEDARTRRAWRPARWIGIAAAAAAVVAGVIAVNLLRGRSGATTASAAPLGGASVMVAPFRVVGAEPSLAYLREGLVELLSTRISNDPARPAVDPGVVLSRWHSAGLADALEISPPELARIAHRLGAKVIVIGNVVGNASKILVSASLIGASDGGVRATATVEGPVDSLSALVDQLAGRLLAADAGETDRLPDDPAPPLAALKAYLGGQVAYRHGRFADAVAQYERALEVDSTFALAAFRLSMAADRLNAAEQHDGALAIAWRYRESLSKRDQAHLVAFAGPRYPAPSPESEQLGAWKRAAALAPDRSEVWQELGERFLYDGPVMGAIDWRERAISAFQRTLVLDPAASMARAHLILLAAQSGDGNALGSLATAAALTDSVGELTPYLTWRVAIAQGDTLMYRKARDLFPDADAANLRWIAMSSLFDAVGVQDGERALRLKRARSTRAADQLDAILAQHSLALNQGRAILALDLTEQLQELQPDMRAHLRLRVLDALYGDGDRESAERAAAELEQLVRVPSASTRGRSIQLADECALEQWRMTHGDRRNTRRVIAHLRAAEPLFVTVPVATPPLVCAEILDASHAVGTGTPNALATLQRLDSLMLTGPAVSDAATYAHLVVARLYARVGQPRAALDAIRRRGYMSGWPRYLATARREEARLTLAAGDTSAAVTLLRRYLDLRHNAESRAKEHDEPLARLLAILDRRGSD
jgi:DNA-binding SARP family transcriptional activator/tetratricopeptide (TPR) repeat protein